LRAYFSFYLVVSHRQFDEGRVHVGFIYEEKGFGILTQIERQYMDRTVSYGLSMMMTPTRRVKKECKC